MKWRFSIHCGTLEVITSPKLRTPLWPLCLPIRWQLRSPGIDNWLDGRIGSAQFRVRGRPKERLFGLNSRRSQLKKLGRFTLRLRQTNNHPSYCKCSWSEPRKFKPVHTNSWKLCFEIVREYLIASLYTTEADRQCEKSLSKKERSFGISLNFFRAKQSQLREEVRAWSNT